MAAITVYGIKNCDTMKKAFDWLDGHGFSYAFHDYKKSPPPRELLLRAFKDLGWEQVINRKGTTWRKLDEKTRDTMDETAALKVALQTPSLIKRPLIVHAKGLTLGFDANEYKKTFTASKKG
jgi:Spx/MgsR family transcriptional regulator